MNDGQTWINSLPENPGTTRDKMVIDAMTNGLAVCQWIPITSTIKDHTAVFQVCDDAVRVEDNGYRFRFQVTAKLAQQCADLWDASPITSKISDLCYQQSQVILGATTLSAGPDMVTTTKSKKWNDSFEKKRNGRAGLIRDCGKFWILDNKLAISAGAVNYGFYDKSAPYVGPGGLKMWQTIGTRHNALHTDYSQVLMLMKKTCLLDNQEVNIVDLMKDPNLSKLLNYDGVLKYTRQPGT